MHKVVPYRALLLSFQCGLDWTQLFPFRMFVRAGMRIAEMFLDKDALFCYVTNREADGEAEVTLEDAHAVTSAPLVKACRSCHDFQNLPRCYKWRCGDMWGPGLASKPGGRHAKRITADSVLTTQVKVTCPTWGAVSTVSSARGALASAARASVLAAHPTRARRLRRSCWSTATRRARARC